MIKNIHDSDTGIYYNSLQHATMAGAKNITVESENHTFSDICIPGTLYIMAPEHPLFFFATTEDFSGLTKRWKMSRFISKFTTSSEEDLQLNGIPIEGGIGWTIEPNTLDRMCKYIVEKNITWIYVPRGDLQDFRAEDVFKIKKAGIKTKRVERSRSKSVW